jgi:lysophospholipase L1-like esterase
VEQRLRPVLLRNLLRLLPRSLLCLVRALRSTLPSTSTRHSLSLGNHVDVAIPRHLSSFLGADLLAVPTRAAGERRAGIVPSVGVYIALGDSISIDDYTGVRGGGAASQLARKLAVELVDLTRDGNTTHGVLGDLAAAPAAADIVTLTAGGNDLLGGDLSRAILRRLHQIAVQIQPLGARVIINTVYDPSDGDNDLGRRELGLSRLATIELRRRLNALNGGIAKLAHEYGFLLADLERLFDGHGLTSDEPWYVHVIEPNLAGATGIAEHWYELLTSA